MPKRTEIEVGTRFGKLVTVAPTFPGRSADGRIDSYVGAVCDCGGSKIVKCHGLLQGKIRSCGCLFATPNCGHPECNGDHSGRPYSNLCPGSKEKMALAKSKRRESMKRRKYVYAILVNESALKIGCSTDDYARQNWHTRSAFRNRGFGKANDSQMIWHRRGDEGIETFLQWRAGRIWKHMINSTRHSEWFDVTGVSPQDIVKHLRRWFAQVELLDQWDAEQQASTATLETATT